MYAKARDLIEVPNLNSTVYHLKQNNFCFSSCDYLFLICCLYFNFVCLEILARSETNSIVSLYCDHLGALHLTILNKSKSDRLEIKKLNVLKSMEVSCQKNSRKYYKISFKSARNSLLVIVHNFKKI